VPRCSGTSRHCVILAPRTRNADFPALHLCARARSFALLNTRLHRNRGKGKVRLSESPPLPRKLALRSRTRSPEAVPRSIPSFRPYIRIKEPRMAWWLHLPRVRAGRTVCPLGPAHCGRTRGRRGVLPVICCHHWLFRAFVTRVAARIPLRFATTLPLPRRGAFSGWRPVPLAPGGDADLSPILLRETSTHRSHGRSAAPLCPPRGWQDAHKRWPPRPLSFSSVGVAPHAQGRPPRDARGELSKFSRLYTTGVALGPRIRPRSDHTPLAL